MAHIFRRALPTVPHDPFHIVVTLDELKHRRRIRLLHIGSTWVACSLAIALSATPLFRQAALNSYVGQNSAKAAASNVTVNFGSAVRTVTPYTFSGTVSTYGQDGGSINNSSKQRSQLNTLGLGMYRVPLQWNNGAVVSSAGGHPGGSGDAWVSNIRASGGVPMIVIGGATNDDNFTPSDAANLVRHFNTNPSTKVTYWVIGNEPSNGSNGSLSIQAYCTIFNNSVDAMRAVDPSIRVAGPAWAFFDSSTLNSFLQCAGSKVDIIDYHHYGMGGSSLSNAAALSQTGNWENEVNQTRQLINQVVPGRSSQIDIQVGEYNWSWTTNDGFNGWNGDDRFFQAVNTVWGASVAGHIMYAGGRGHQYSDQNGALSLTFEKNSDANHFGQTINDPMPIYYGLEMFTGGNLFRHFGATAVSASTTLANTEVFASTSEKNIVLINKDPSVTQSATVTTGGVMNGTADVWQTNQSAPFAAPAKKGTAAITNGIVTVGLPPYSVTTMVVTETAAPIPAPVPTPVPSPLPKPPIGSGSTAPPTNPGTTAPTGGTVTIGTLPSSIAPVVSGTIQLAPPILSPGIQTTYKVDGKTINGTQLNTKTLSNGAHTVTVTQQTADGKKTTATQKIIVKNRLSHVQQTALIVRKYSLPTLVLITAVGILVIATKRYIHWRFVQAHPLVNGMGLTQVIKPQH
jgi:hypothetical protein